MPQKVLMIGSDPLPAIAGFECVHARLAPRSTDADLIILDYDPLSPGAARVIQELRTSDPERPIVVLSNRSEIAARLAAFQNGADDYLIKPYDLRELLARAKAHLRRLTAVRFGSINVDFVNGTVTKNGTSIALSTRELQLLRYLVRNRPAIVSREELLARVWGYRSQDTRTVDMHVAAVRRKVEDEPQHPRFILTVRGRGYQFKGE